MKLITTEFNAFLNHLKNVSPFEYIVEILPKCTKDGPWIAGGCLHRTYRDLSLADADVDIFFKNEAQLDKFLLDLSSNALTTGKYKTTAYFVSEWHRTVTVNYMDIDWKIQCVCFKYFENIEQLFTSFDINVCRIAYDGENIISEENIFDEIKANNLRFNDGSIYYPSVTLKRLVKYIKMGYNIQDVELKRLTHAFYKSKKKEIDILDQDLFTKKPIETYKGMQ
jgi:hypothetical protein